MVIKIGDKKYIGQCNALSYVFHNRLFKKNIIGELNNLIKLFVKLDKKTLTEEDIENIYNILTRVIYTLIYTYDSSIYGFDDFKKDINQEVILNDSINEIIELLITNFTDEEVSKEFEKISSDNTERSIFPEHEFLITCLQLKLTIQDLKILSYIDVMKMSILTLNTVKEDDCDKARKATQLDIDKLLM